MSDDSGTSPIPESNPPAKESGETRESSRQALTALLKAGAVRRYPAWLTGDSDQTATETISDTTAAPADSSAREIRSSERAIETGSPQAADKTTGEELVRDVDSLQPGADVVSPEQASEPVSLEPAGDFGSLAAPAEAVSCAAAAETDFPEAASETASVEAAFEVKVQADEKGEEPASIIEHADGAVVELDLSGRVVKTRDAKGEERRFGWDSKNRLREVILPFGRWTSTDGKTWTNNQGKTKSGIRRVDGDGTYWEEDEIWRRLNKLDGTQVEVHKPGASITVLFKNGSTLSQYQDHGTVRQIRNEDGSEYQYLVTEDGRLRPLYHKYAKPTRIEFGTAEGAHVVEDIREVHFSWQEVDGILKMTYRSNSGNVYVLERGRHGEFKSFSQSN